MLVAGIRSWGAAVERFEIADPRPPRDGEVLIEVRAAGVGDWDEAARKGEWDLGRAPPLALGVEAAGVVRAIGPGVQRCSAGDQVLTHPLPLVDQGTWAPWLVARRGADRPQAAGRVVVTGWRVRGPGTDGDPGAGRGPPGGARGDAARQRRRQRHRWPARIAGRPARSACDRHSRPCEPRSGRPDRRPSRYSTTTTATGRGASSS